MTIFDIADRRHPAEAARGENLTAVVYRESRDTGGALMVVDWSDPTAPTVVSRYLLPDGASAKRVLVRDGYAYVVAKETDDAGTTATALYLLDVTHPKDISLVGKYRAPRLGAEYEPVARGQHYVLGLIGSYALIAGHEPVIRVVNVSDPQPPTEVQQLPVSAVVTDLAVSDPYAYVVLEDGESVILRRSSWPDSGLQTAVYLPLIERASARHDEPGW